MIKLWECFRGIKINVILWGENNDNYSMETLYIIGAGVYIHRNLSKSYRAFGLFLKEKYPVIYSRLIEYYGFSGLVRNEQRPAHEPLWSEVEKNLSLLNPETVFEAHSDSLTSPGSPNFKDRNWGSFAIDMELVVDSLTSGVFKAFNVIAPLKDK